MNPAATQADAQQLAVVMLVMTTVWFLVAIALYVWYAAMLAKVFQKYGLPAWQAWVPVYNQMQLFGLGGQPKWAAILLYLPIVQLVGLYFLILAVHRITTQNWRGVGTTVLGVLLPPVWATILAGGPAPDPERGRMVRPAGAPATGPSPVASGPLAVGQYQGVPPVAPLGAPPAPPQGAPYGAPAAPYPAAAPAAPAQPFAAPAAFAPPAPAQPAAPAAPAAAFQPPAPAAPAAVPAPAAPAPAAPAAPLLSTAGPDAAPRVIQTGAVPIVGAQGAQGAPGAPAPATPGASFAPPAADPAPLGGAEEARVPGRIEPLPPMPGAPAGAGFAESASAFADSASVFAGAASAFAASAFAETAFAPAGDDEIADAATVVVGYVDEEIDRTVVVDRQPKARWSLVTDDGTLLPLEASVVVLGRNPRQVADGEQRLIVPDPSRTLSKTHAELRRDGEQWSVIDLGSTNGVLVPDASGDEQLLEPGVATPVAERFVLGTLGLRLQRDAQPSQGAILA